jgi:hypothetical protein
MAIEITLTLSDADIAYFADPSDLVPDAIPGARPARRRDHGRAGRARALARARGVRAVLCGTRRGHSQAGVDAAERQRRLAECRRSLYARMDSRREERARRGSWRSIFR